MNFTVGDHVLVVTGLHFAKAGRITEVKTSTYIIDFDSHYGEVRKDEVQAIVTK